MLKSTVNMLSPVMEENHFKEPRMQGGGSRGAKNGFDKEFDDKAGGT